MAFKLKRKLKKYHNDNPQYRIVTIEQPLSLAAESYRRIKTSLEFANVDTPPQVIQVCSSMQGEGKSVTCLNIAATYAEDKKKVLVVDLDFRRPKLHRSFHVENKDGITDVLSGSIKLEAAIKHGNNGIDCLNRGEKAPYPTAVLGSEQMAKLFEELRKMYEYIIVDCPPILAVSDATIISKLCDGCLFVISQSRTEKAAAKEAVKILRDNNIVILGCVFCGITSKGSNYYHSKYKYYYQNYYGRDVNPQSFNASEPMKEDEEPLVEEKKEN